LAKDADSVHFAFRTIGSRWPLELPHSLGMLSLIPRDGPEMADETDKTARQTRTSRDDRLKSALRENLKRRKVQARERAATTEPSQNEDGSLDEDVAGKSGS
jgi:hypothetical protein